MLNSLLLAHITLYKTFPLLLLITPQTLTQMNGKMVRNHNSLSYRPYKMWDKLQFIYINMMSDNFTRTLSNCSLTILKRVDLQSF